MPNWKVLVKVAVSSLLLTFLIKSTNPQALLGALSAVSIPWLLAAGMLVILSVVISVQKWRIILTAQGNQLSWRELWRAYWVGLFFNNFLPSSIGGDAMRIIRIGKQSGDVPGVTASVILERLLATVAIALVGGLGAIWVEAALPEVQLVFGGLLLATLVLAGLLCLPLRRTAESGEVASPAAVVADSYLWSKGKALFVDLYRKSRLLQPKTALFEVVLWSVAFQTCVVAVNYCIFQGLQLDQLSFLDLVYLIPATSIAAMLPLGLNGYGIREGAYLALLLPYGVAAEKALAASLLFALLVSVLSLWGGIVWLVSKQKEDSGYVNLERLENC